MRSTSHIVIVFLCLVLFNIAASSQAVLGQTSIAPSRETVLSGGDWKLEAYPIGEGEKQNVYSATVDETHFRTVAVPGEVQVQLGLTGMDRYYQSKELSTINDKEWWYRKQFVVPTEDRGKLVKVEFEGVDYYASVWLNGKKLGEHEGAYTAFSYDVSSLVNYGGKNTLAVKVTCPWFPTDRGFGEYLKGDWMMPDPTQISFPREPFVLGPYWGGTPAYGNAAFPMGLFRDVKLVASGWLVVENLFVRTQALADSASARLEITGTITNYSLKNTTANLELQIEPDNFSGSPRTLPVQTNALHPGQNAFRREVMVQDAHLWWTWDMGKQDLYKLTAVISAAAGAGKDSTTTKFGIRTIRRQDDMSYWLNGKRLFLKGAWYPMSNYFASLAADDTYLKDLVLFKAANLNHIVNFTVVEKPVFYDLCDQLGILIITELPFNQFGPMQALKPSYPRYGAFVKSALAQVQDIIIALRNHPSIMEWAAFAESHQKSTGGWGFGPASFAAYDYQTFSDEIGRLVARLDGGTIYQPSLCDFGEQHFWMGGPGTKEGYNQHFNAQTGFVSEYGSLAFPSIQSLEKFLRPEDLWGEQNKLLPAWFNLPIRVSAYAYLASFEYDGLLSILSHLHQFVDRDVRSAQELVDDTQLYQAFIMKYATEAYRRKMHKPINGIRVWSYVEYAPGIQWGFVDYNRIPKMAYYYLRNAQGQFALNFAREDELESQVSGKELKIPIWLVNEYRRQVPVQVQCEIDDLQGHEIWKNQFAATAGPDASQQVGEVNWVAPDSLGVYVLRGRATEVGGKLQAENRTFIKVTPKLFPRPARVLVIGEKKYALPLATLLRAIGTKVEQFDEEDFPKLQALKDPNAIKRNYDVVWLASFDSAWKLLNQGEAEGLKQAISEGVAFVHTGGPGSFHGGFGKGACLEFTPLAEVLPVKLRTQNDLVYGEATPPQRDGDMSAGRITSIAATDSSEWDTSLLKKYGVAGFNEVGLKDGSRQILTISGLPLLVEGQYGRGRTIAFTGFTPEHLGEHAFWDPAVVFPYMVDQELYTNPGTQAYLDLFMRIMARAMGQKPEVSYEHMLAAREVPLFEILKEQAKAELDVPEKVDGMVSGAVADVRINLENKNGYARLVRLSATWETAKAPSLETYSDNYFDLMPEEKKTIVVQVFVPRGSTGTIKGRFTVQGSNVSPVDVPVALRTQ